MVKARGPARSIIQSNTGSGRCRRNDIPIEVPRGNTQFLGRRSAARAIRRPACSGSIILTGFRNGVSWVKDVRTKPGQAVVYEAAWTSKSGKRSAVLVKGDGSETKD